MTSRAHHARVYSTFESQIFVVYPHGQIQTQKLWPATRDCCCGRVNNSTGYVIKFLDHAVIPRDGQGGSVCDLLARTIGRSFSKLAKPGLLAVEISDPQYISHSSYFPLGPPLIGPMATTTKKRWRNKHSRIAHTAYSDSNCSANPYQPTTKKTWSNCSEEKTVISNSGAHLERLPSRRGDPVSTAV